MPADALVSGIFVVGPDGGTARQIGPDIRGLIEDLVWTLDGRHLTVLVASGRADAPKGLHTLDLEGNTDRVISMRVLQDTTRLGGYSPNGRWLTFQAKTDYAARPDLWILPAAGGKALRVSDRADALARSDTTSWLHHPTWAADGRALYFISDRSGSPNVWKVSLDPQTGERQGDAEQVTYFQDATILHPKMLADGRMAFALRRANSIVHVAHPLRTGAVRPLVRGLAPQLSPDGQTIYYVGEGTFQDGIFAIPREGGTPRALTHSRPPVDHLLRGFELSPDGQTLAYQIREGDEIGLFTVPTGREAQPRRLVTLDVAGGGAPEPKWSPDGSLLAFGHDDGLYVIPATGGRARKLAHLDALELENWSVRWSPDGQYLAALGSPTSGGPSVFVVPSSGGEPQRLTSAAYNDYKEGLEWHPDGERLTYMNYGPDGIWQAYRDGRPPTLLIDQPDLWDYLGRWAPGGRRFFFVSFGIGWGLYVYDDRTGETTVVWPSDEGSAGFPSFSRDGTTVTWSVTTGVSQLWLMENFR